MTIMLHQFIHDTQIDKIDFNIYILQYIMIMTSLVAQDILFILDRMNRLFDKLSYEYKKKVLSFCTKNNWKLSTQNVDIIELNYDELKLFVFHEAQTSQI